MPGMAPLVVLLVVIVAVCTTALGPVSAAAASCDALASCYLCSASGTVSSGGSGTPCEWCSPHSTTDTTFGNCIDPSTASCSAPLVATNVTGECLVPLDCSVFTSCSRCLAVEMPPPAATGIHACAWTTTTSGGSCLPVLANDRVGLAVSLSCAAVPFLVAASSHHAANLLGVIGATIVLIVMWFACFRPLSNEPRDWRWRVQGLPCSPQMLSTFFAWHDLQDDGFGGLGAQTIEPPAAQNDETRLVAAGGEQSDAAAAEPEIVDWARDNTWCPRLRWPPMPFQMSIASDLLICLLFSVALFIDRWYITPRKQATLMQSDIIWGAIQVKYGASSGLSGPKTHFYDCDSIDVLDFMHTGQCAAIKGTGVLIYMIGLVYFLLILVRLYTSTYASLRNIALIAYRRRVEQRGRSWHKRRNGCHVRLVYTFLQQRYLRFYSILVLLIPLAVFRFLSVRDALIEVEQTSVHVSAVLLVICALIELGSLIYETRVLETILQNLDDANEERRARGLYVAEDEDEAAEDPEQSVTRTHRPRTRPRDPERIEDDDDVLKRHLADDGGMGPLDPEDDEAASWAESDAVHEARAKSLISRRHDNEDDEEEKEGSTVPASASLDSSAVVMPAHEPIYSSYVVPAALAPPPSFATSSPPILPPPSMASETAAETEMSTLSSSLALASTTASSSTARPQPLPSMGARRALGNHTSYDPALAFEAESEQLNLDELDL